MTWTMSSRPGRLAFTELMVDPATVAVTLCRTVGLEAAAIDLLLYDWLSELIFLKDRDCQVFTRAVTFACSATARGI